MRAGDRKALNDWDEHLLNIRRATPVDKSEHPRDKELRIERLLKDFSAFCKYYFPRYCSAPFAKFHLDQQQAVFDNERGVFVWIMARAHAKTTVHTVMGTIFLMMHNEARTILLASYNETNAIRILSSIKAQLEANDRLKSDFGEFMGLNGWEAAAIKTRQGHLLVAVGSGQSPRGLSNEEVRPDLIICDDLDEDEQSRNPERVDNVEKWVRGSLFGTFDIIGRARFIMVGNRFAENMVLTRMYESADHRMIINILDKKGNPSWPERYSKEACQYMIDKLGYNISQREYFNNPIKTGTVFKREWIQYKKLPPLHTYKAIVGYLDPGFKKSSTADSKAWVLVGVHNGEYHIIRAFVSVASVNEMIAWGYDLRNYVRERGGAAQLWMEEVFLQDILYRDFNEEGKKRNDPLPLRGDRRKKPDKDVRIEALSGLFERGHVYFNADMKDEHNMKELVEQFLNFQVGVKTHKDGPDATEGAIHQLQGAVNAQAEISVGTNARNRHAL